MFLLNVHQCAFYLCLHYVSLWRDVYTCVSTHVFPLIRVGLCVCAVKVNVVSIKGSGNRIAQGLIDSQFSSQSLRSERRKTKMRWNTKIEIEKNGRRMEEDGKWDPIDI